MLYTTFIRLCDEAVKYNDCEEFIMNLGWQGWMDKYADTESITDDLAIIFNIAGLNFSDLRKTLGISMAKMSVYYQIPTRTIESWESSSSSSRNAAPYIINLIRFTIFAREKEGDDGYLEEQD